MFPSRDSAQDNWQRVLWDAAFKRGSESLIAVLEDLHKPVTVSYTHVTLPTNSRV